MAAKAKPSDVLVSRHNDICYILSVSKTTLESLTGKLFQMQIVDRLTKIAIMSQGGYAGADALLDYVEMRVDNKPTILQSVFEAMQENESLEEIVQQIKAKWDNESKQFLSADYPQFVVEQQRDVQEHGAIKKSKLVSSDRTELNQLDPVVEARYLKQEFEELLVDIQNLIQEVDLDNLKLRITWFFNAENAITPEIHNKVDKLQSLTTPQNVLNFLIINSFIGYLNYEIIKAFQKATKSEEMKIKIEEYEKKHDVFLHQFPYGSLIDAFKQNSELAPVSVVGLPKFTVKLATTWEGKSAYTWKEFFQNIFTWPPHLIIVSIERNCIVLTYAVLPFFVSSVVRDLQNPLIIKQLKKEGVSVELSPDLSKMGEKENNTEGLQEGEVTGKRETLSKIGEGNTFQKEQEVVGKIGKSSGVEDIQYDPLSNPEPAGDYPQDVAKRVYGTVHVSELLSSEKQLKIDFENAIAAIKSGEDAHIIVASATHIADRVEELVVAEINESDNPQLKRKLTIAKDTLHKHNSLVKSSADSAISKPKHEIELAQFSQTSDKVIKDIQEIITILNSHFYPPLSHPEELTPTHPPVQFEINKIGEEAPLQISMDSGYDPDMFINTPPDDLICPVCHLVLRDPCLQSCCGAHVCQVCMTHWKTYNKGCPRCRSDKFTTVINKSIRSRVIELTVRCENRDCTWKGELLDLQRHVSEKCLYTPKICQYGCGKYYHHEDLPVHEQDECPNRPREVIIESGQRNKKKLKELEVKYQNQEDLLIHYENEIDEQKKIRKEEAETYKMERKKMIAEKEQLYKNQHLLQQKISKMEQEQSLLQGFTTDKLPEWLLPVSRYYLPPLIRVMNNFSTRKKTSNIYYSRAFHTHPGGYKLQFEVVANGSGHGRGTHVSVHVYLMKGENDAELEWPFQSQIIVRLLNWRENKQHVEKVIRFTERDPLLSCSRVSEAETSERAPIGLGDDRFISHHYLDYSPKENKEYLCDDMLCFQVYEIILPSDNTDQVKLYPMLLTFSGLPNSKKSKALNKLAPIINNDNNPLGFSHDQFVVRGFGTTNEKQYTHVKSGFPIESLSSDNGLMNIWDLGVNRTIIPFLYRFSGHISRNYMLLFLDLDRDVDNLHEPPSVHDPLVMNWQSRIQYFFRSCQLSKGNKKKIPCKLFATYSKNNKDENEDGDLHVDEAAKSPQSLRVPLSTLRRECGIVAKQMGVEDLVDIDIIPIDMESNEDEKLLKDHLQKLFIQLEPQNIPKSWMHFRSSLAQYGSSYINDEELQHEARRFGIEESLGEFCKFFTSFGSILDVRLIDPKSKYIIIKPNEYLYQLQFLFDQVKETSSYELIFNGVIHDTELSTFNEEVFLEILHSVGEATRLPKNTIIKDTTIPGPAFYIPSVRIGEEKRNCTRGAIQLVMGMESSPVNMQTMIIDYLLCQFENSQLILTTSINTAAIRVATPKGPFEIEITSQGDVIEFVSRGEEKYGGTYENICQHIVRFCSKFAQKMTDQYRDIKYHFSITCEMDRYKELGYNIYHRRHVLPSDKLCKTCRVKHVDDGQITIWNKILNETPIEETFRLNGDLTLDNITALATEIFPYHHTALSMFAEELEVPLIKPWPDTPSLRDAIVVWKEKWQKENDESAKKALARKLMNLDTYWQEWIENQHIPEQRNVNFKLCARQLDIQVYAENQLQFMRQISTDYVSLKQRDLENQLRQKEEDLGEIKSQLHSAKKKTEKLKALLLTANQDDMTVTRKVIQCIRDEIQRNYGYLSAIFQPSIKEIGAEMVQVGILPLTAGQNPAFETIISVFLAIVANANKLQEIKEKCEKFFSTFYLMGGPFVEAADNVKEKIRKSVQQKVGIELNI